MTLQLGGIEILPEQGTTTGCNDARQHNVRGRVPLVFLLRASNHTPAAYKTTPLLRACDCLKKAYMLATTCRHVPAMVKNAVAQGPEVCLCSL